MRKKHHLLDHKWQKIGFVIFAVCVLLCIVCFKAITYDLIPQTQPKIEYKRTEVQKKNGDIIISNEPINAPIGSGWASALVLLFTPISFALMALSQEIQEDERIVEIRHQALVTIVIIYIVWALLMFITTPFLVHLTSPTTMGKINMILKIPTGVPAFMGYYLLIFKLSLWKQNRELNDEE